MPDYIFMLQSRLSPEQWQLLNRLQDLAQKIPVNLYLVGGAVRDLMTGSPIHDLDFVVEGNPLKLIHALDEKDFQQFHWDESQRAGEMVLRDWLCCSIEMARIEVDSARGGTRAVKPASILEDLRRRDFSINAIGISLNPGSRGLLLDPTNGLADLETRALRVLHNYSFVRDPVRLLRLVRFSTRLNLALEPRTKELFLAALEKGYAERISPASAGREMVQLTREDSPTPILKAWQRNGLLAVFHPRLQRRGPDDEGLAKLQKYRQAVLSAGYVFDPFALLLHFLLKRLKPRDQQNLFRNLRLSHSEAAKVLDLEREVRKVAKLLARLRHVSPREVYNLLAPIPLAVLVFVLVLFSGKKKIQAKVQNYLFRYQPLRRQLPVRELELLGVPHGPKFDQILEQFFYARLEGKLRSRAEQIRFLKKVSGVVKPLKKVAEGKREPTRQRRASRLPAR